MKFWYRLCVHSIAIGTFFMRLKYKYETLDDVHFYQEYIGRVLQRRMTRRNTLGYVTRESTNYDWLKDAAGGLIIDADSQMISDDDGSEVELQSPGIAKERVPKRGPGRVAVIVANHLGWPEIFNLVCSPIFPGFTPKKEIVELPFAGTIATGLSSLFVSRGANPEEREKVVEEIVERQRLIEVDNLPYQPFCVFAEGTTSNGRALLPFKRGAFAAMRTVQPCFVTLSDGQAVRPCYDIMNLPELLVMLCSRFSFTTSTLTIMPPFMPNEKMLELHADKGEQDWEIFAWCVRDAISKYGSLPKSEGSLREKNTYSSLYSGKAKEIEIGGKTYDSTMFGQDSKKNYDKMPEDPEAEQTKDDEIGEK